ncbi:MAG: FtsW/RodA/SpoVE family cell cycle protein [Actinomycetia bacterium]|nr:FtsW/RodA/SpoVE family cell cycle protein [Actinomycetes bacterium]
MSAAPAARHTRQTAEEPGLSRRNVELLLILAASPVLALLFALAILASGQPLTLSVFAVPIGLFGSFLLAHLAVRWLAPAADPALLPIVFMLSGIGIAFVLRLSPDTADRQVLWLFLSIAAMVVVLFAARSISKLTDYKYTLMIIGLVLLLLPAVIGVERGGSKIWLSFLGYSFQPGELAKVLIVLFLAGYMADNREMLSMTRRSRLGLKLPDLRTLMPLLIMWAISLLIVIFERDLGSALLFFGIFLIMLYIATGRLIYVAVGALLAIGGCMVAWTLFSHVQVRVATWIDPFAYRNDSGYQLSQALYSLADGGMIGTGIGQGMPGLIPVVSSDFIFDAIAEEMGLLGAAAVLILFLLFAVRGLIIAARAKSDVEAFCAVGLTAAISLQAFIIVGGVTRLIPLTGVTLPFMSQGGSSLLASFIIVGLLLRAGDSGTGLGTEMIGVQGAEGGILGRFALGRRLTIFIGGLSALFALLIVNLGWYMVVQAPALQADPANSHVIIRDLNRPRGSIISANGVVLAQSVQDASGTWQRQYPQGSLAAHLVGYRSATYGAAGIEARYSDTLTGRADFSSWPDAVASMAGVVQLGNDVRLTCDTRIQAAAELAISSNMGAAIVMDAQTGAVLAMASSPTFKPASIDSLLKDSSSGNGSGGNQATSELYNRATANLYAPGSTFKTVTLASALASGVTSLEDYYDAPPRLSVGNADITNYHLNDYGNVSLLRGYELSSNTVFAQLAEQLGAERLVAGAERFGFNQPLQSDFDVAMSLMPKPAEMTDWETAWAGIGQPVGEHPSPAGPQVTVVQMAMVAATIANDGLMMKPHVTSSITSPEGKILQATPNEAIGQVLNQPVVNEMQMAMQGVVEAGTATATKIPGYTVRGKTGTAETGRPTQDSWFTGWVEVGGRKIVVAIVLEQQATTGAAVPQARQIFTAAIDAYGK